MLFSQRPSSRRGRKLPFVDCLLLPRDVISCDGIVVGIRVKGNCRNEGSEVE